MSIARNGDRTVLLVAGVLLGVALTSDVQSTTAAEMDLGRRTYSTANFEISARGSAAELEAWGRRCEALREALREKWFDASSGAADWSPRCIVVLHDHAASYLRAVPGGDRTVGSSLVEYGRGSIKLRRIDVRGDRGDWITEVLPHEMMHVLLADRALRSPLPRWAEEGLALLADSAAKQAAHDSDFRHALDRRRQFRLVELVSIDGYPSPERVAAFYGQSASLVRFLAAHGKPRQLVDFIEQSSQVGHDVALRKIYGINGLAALESAWLQSLRSDTLAVR